MQSKMSFVPRLDRVSEYRNIVYSRWSYVWWNWIIKHKDLVIDIYSDDDKLDWCALAVNPNMTLDLLRENIHEFYNKAYHWIFKNPCMTWDFVLEFMQIGYIPCCIGWMYISGLDTVTWDIVKSNPHYPWDWDVLTQNPNIPVDIIIHNPEYQWSNDILNERLLQTNSEQTTDGNDIYKFKQCAYCISKDCESSGYGYGRKSGCESLLFSEVDRDPDKSNWIWANISSNPFTKQKELYITEQYRRYLAAYRIQQWWLRIRLDPYHPIGRRRLEQEYDALFKVNAS